MPYAPSRNTTGLRYSKSTSTFQRRAPQHSPMAPDWAIHGLVPQCQPPLPSGLCPSDTLSRPVAKPTRRHASAMDSDQFSARHQRWAAPSPPPACWAHSSESSPRPGPQPPPLCHPHQPCGHREGASLQLSRPHRPPRSPLLRQLPGLGVVSVLHGDQLPWSFFTPLSVINLPGEGIPSGDITPLPLRDQPPGRGYPVWRYYLLPLNQLACPSSPITARLLALHPCISHLPPASLPLAPSLIQPTGCAQWAGAN